MSGGNKDIAIIQNIDQDTLVDVFSIYARHFLETDDLKNICNQMIDSLTGNGGIFKTGITVRHLYQMSYATEYPVIAHVLNHGGNMHVTIRLHAASLYNVSDDIITRIKEFHDELGKNHMYIITDDVVDVLNKRYLDLNI